jgi:hypothetical protein
MPGPREQMRQNRTVAGVLDVRFKNRWTGIFGTHLEATK